MFALTLSYCAIVRCYLQCELKCAEDILAKQGPCDASSGSPVTTSGDDDNLDVSGCDCFHAPVASTCPSCT